MRELKFMKAKPVATSTSYVVVLLEWVGGIIVSRVILNKHPFKYVGGANSFARTKKKEMGRATVMATRETRTSRTRRARSQAVSATARS